MKRIAVLLILLHSVFSFAQIDTAFWFAAPDLSASHQQVPIRFCFTTYGQAATITISQPASNSFVTQTLNVAANGFATLDMSSLVDSVETTPAFTVLNRGFYISSTSPISCYYECIGDNSEIYNLKGRSALGTDFLIATQNFHSYSYDGTSSIEIVASEDNTTIQITSPTALADGSPAFSTLTIHLNRGQCYAVQAASSGHLGNTIIHSDKPIAINVTEDSLSISFCADLVGDQIVPTSYLGTKYVAIKNNSSYETVFLFPTESNTAVAFNGVPYSTMLNEGGFIQHNLDDTATLITADKPIAVFQLTGLGCEAGGTVLPNIECTGSHLVRFLRPSQGRLNLTLVVNTQYIDNFVLNGNPNLITAADFRPVPTDSSLSYCFKLITTTVVPTDSVMTIENPSGLFQCGIINGGGANCTYGYFSGYAQASYIHIDMDSVYCPGDSIVFYFDSPDIDSITLHGPNGLVITEQPFILRDVTTEINGTYWITGIDTASCFNEMTDSIHITVRPDTLEVLFEIDTEFCAYKTVDIQFSSNIQNEDPRQLVDTIYFPNGTILLPDSLRHFTIDHVDSTYEGWWVLKAHSPQCSSIIDFDSIYIHIENSKSLSVFDIIPESQLPWTWRETTFYSSADTVFLIPDSNGECDSVIYYHLTVYNSTIDTTLYYICEDELPFDAGDTILHHADTWTRTHTGSHGEMVIEAFVLRVIPSTDTTIYDTIINSQLPLFIYDTIIDTAFTDSIIQYTYHTYNEAGCDSTIYYNLYIYWNGDHCDTNLTYPNVVTPNGDGKNDKFVIGGLIENKCFRYSELIIYNSFGQKVYLRKNICKDEDWWDPGADRMPSGTYYFYFKAHGVNIKTQHIGVIEVLREK